MQSHDNRNEKNQDHDRKLDRSNTVNTDQAKEMTVYGRHFMSKPPGFLQIGSSEKKMIINILWSGISIQSVPSTASNLEIIKYRDIINVYLSQDKDNEVIIVYNNRLAPPGKNPQIQQNFKSNDRNLFLSDFYRGLDIYCSANNIKQLGGVSQNFTSITASYIVDKTTKSYFEARLTCYNSHLTIEVIRPTFLNDKKFEQLRSNMFYANSKNHNQSQKAMELIGGDQKEQNQQEKNQQNANGTNPYLNGQNSVISIKYKDIVRIQKKANGFQINLIKPSLTMAFYLNDLNQVSGFVNRIQKNSKEATKLDVSVTSTLQEEIHRSIKFNEKEMEVDFAIYASRIMLSKAHKRQCILALGKSGIYEVDIIDAEVYEQYDLKFLKDIVRQEQTGTVRNTIKLIFFNGQEVEYVFEPYQRDLFIVEILTNINMYYDSQSPCRRCLDMMHSRTPNYQLEIYGWKYDGGTSDRDKDVDNELMTNIIYAKGEDAFFSALREFNVNCNLKKTADADLNVYRQLVVVLSRYLEYFEDPDLLFFLKHIKIVKTIPSISRQSFNESTNQNLFLKSVQSADSSSVGLTSTWGTNRTRKNSQESMLQHENEHYEKLLNLQRDAIHKIVDEEYSSHKDHRAANQNKIQSKHQLDGNNIINDDSDDDIFENEQSPMTKRNQQIEQLQQGQNKLYHININPFQQEDVINQNEDIKNKAKGSGSFHQLSSSVRYKVEMQPNEYVNQKINENNKEIKKLFNLCFNSEYNWQEYELMQQMRSKSVALLKKLNKTQIVLKSDAQNQSSIQLNAESVEALTLKIEEMLKCLTIFQNCKRYFEEKGIKTDKFQEFKSILQLLSNPDPLIVYQTSQLFKRMGFYHTNTMQKAETENKNFLLDARFNILDRVFYQISNYTLIKRPLSQYTFMVRIYSCLSIINTLFQARIESTSSIHRQSIITQLQTPAFFAVISRILRYNSFSLIVNSINLMNALYYFSVENQSFLNMILQNSTMLLFLIHLVIQDTYSSSQLKDISFNLLFSLLHKRSQACYVVMNVFPKTLFKMPKTESPYVNEWTKQEWYSFFFTQVQNDITQPNYYWQKSNLKILDDALLKEDKSFLQQYLYTVFKKVNHVCDIQQFYPYLFSKDDLFGKQMLNPLPLQQTQATSNKSTIKGNPSEVVQNYVSPQEIEYLKQINDLQKDIFAKLYWNIDDFKIEYENVQDQFLCGRYYIKQLIPNNKYLQFDFVDEKNQIKEKEIKEFWESLVFNLMNQSNKQKQAFVIRMMTILYKAYSKVIKVTNIVPYLIHILNLHEFQSAQYSLVQLILTVINSDDPQAKQFHCNALIENNGIQQLINTICQRISLQEDNTDVTFGQDATILKLPEVKKRGDENLYIIFMCIKMINGCIQMHSHIYKKREIYPLTKPQIVCLQKKNWRIMQNILLLKNDQNQSELTPQAIVRNEYLKLINDYLLNDQMLHIKGFCEILIDQLNENTMKLTFTIMKALFFRLPDAKNILEEIINGSGLQKKHIEAYPFFKFFPVQLLLILLNDYSSDDVIGYGKSDVSTPSGVVNALNLSQQKTASNTNTVKDSGVDNACASYKSDNQDRYDLIWNKQMRLHLKEKLSEFLSEYKESINEFHNNNFKPGKLIMTDYRIVTDDKINQYPIITSSYHDCIYFPQLKNEITSCQIYLRLWAKYKNDDTENFDIPLQFAQKTIEKIQFYSFQPDIFKVLNDKTSSAMKNLLHILKAHSKIYKNRIQVKMVYPYNDILSILQTCIKIVKDSADDPSNLEDLVESALEEAQTPSSPLTNQKKRNSFYRQNSHSELPQSPSRTSLFLEKKLSTDSRSSNSNLNDLSFSNPLTDCIQTTFNQYIKASLKVIYHSLRDRKNFQAFTEKNTGIECILYALSNIVREIHVKNINRQDVRNYFDDLSVSYSEIKIMNYSILILQEIYDTTKVKLNHLTQQQRNDLCLLIQRIQKITTTFFHTFLEKFTGNLNSNVKEKYGNSLQPPQRQKSGKNERSASPVLVNSHSTTSLLSVASTIANSQTMPANTPSPQYTVLLDKLFNVDPENLLSYSGVIIEKCFKACRQLNSTLSWFTLSLSKNAYFLESLIRGGCVWRAIEIILEKGKPFNTLQNNEKKSNITNLDDITIDYAKMLHYILQNCEFIKKFENGTQQLSLSLKPVQAETENQKQIGSGNLSFGSYCNIDSDKKQDKVKEENEQKKIGSSSFSNNQDSKSITQNELQSNSNEASSQKIKKNQKQNCNLDIQIIEEDKSKSDDRSSQKQNSSIYSKSNQDDTNNENNDSECSSPTRRRRTEDEKKEYQYYNMQLLREIGPLGRDKLMFFVNQFLIALTRNVDNNLLKYLNESRYDQFTRKINSNIELPDFIWNQITRDKLDQNLKLQLINVNDSLGKIFLDKLLQHQGIIQIEDSHTTTKQTNQNNQNDTSPINSEELKICGIYLRIFNESDNFEITNPQTFQQEIFNSLKQNIQSIQNILKEQAPTGAYDILAVNQLFPSQIKAVKECIKATLSLLTRYSVSYIVLNPDNIASFFNILLVKY